MTTRPAASSPGPPYRGPYRLYHPYCLYCPYRPYRALCRALRREKKILQQLECIRALEQNNIRI